jgi:hypothetical protein
MKTFLQFINEQEQPEDPSKKLANATGSLYSVLNIDLEDVEGAIENSSPLLAQGTVELPSGIIDQIGLAQLDVEPLDNGRYRISIKNENGNLLYRDGRKVKHMHLIGTVDEDTYNRIMTQGLTGWNNIPKKTK